MHQFDKDIAITSGDGGHYTGVISSNWSINKVPNGGDLMAVMANAMLQAGTMKATPIVTANFLNGCQPGKAIVDIEQMSHSRRAGF